MCVCVLLVIVENTSIHFVSKKLSSFFLADLHLANCGQAKERKMAFKVTYMVYIILSFS